MTEQAATMSGSESRGLSEALDRVARQVDKVDFWACAFGGLVAPVPDYDIASNGPLLPPARLG